MRPILTAAAAICVHASLFASQDAPAADEWSYRFSAEKELADFEPLSGSWKISAGDLWCTSKGAREELRWRRAISASGSASVKIVGAGRVGVLLCAGREETLVRVDRGDARVVVEVGGATALDRRFEVAASDPIALAIAWTPARVTVRVGDDEALAVERAPAAAPFTKLALVSMKSQPRLDDLVIARETAPAPEPAAEAPAPDGVQVVPLTEELRIVIERAAGLAASDPEGAFGQIAGALPEVPAGGAIRFPAPAMALLQELATARPSLRTKPPLKELIAAATVTANDRSATLTLPLHRGWTAQTPEVRRKEAVLFVAKSASPPLELQVFRYDPQIQYAFGRNPKLVLTTGGGGPTLGHAKADDEKERHPDAVFTRPFDKGRLELAGETVYEYQLAWPEEDPEGAAGKGARTQALREHFVLHRGDTWQVSIRGFQVDVELAAADLDWMLANLRFVHD